MEKEREGVIEMAKVVKQAEVAKVAEERGQKFNCGVCGVAWESKIKRGGVRLCVVCVELRRALNGFLRKGLETVELKERVETILEM